MIISSEESIESTVRSISRKEDISCNFSADYLDLRLLNQNNFFGQKITLPKIKNIKEARAIGDLAALYLAYHEPAIHNNYDFAEAKQQKLFDDLEKARLIIVGSKTYLGIKNNLKNLIENEVREIAKIEDIPFSLIQKNLNILQEISAIDFEKDIAVLLERLGQKVSNQEDFAKLSADFIAKIKDKSDQNQSFESLDRKSDSDLNQDPWRQKELASKPSPDLDSQPSDENPNQQGDIGQIVCEVDEADDNKDKKTINKKPAPDIGISKIEKAKIEKKIEFIDAYKIFTKKFDKITKAGDLAERSELLKLRKDLDLKIADLDKISHKLKAKLKRRMLSKKVFFKQHDKEEGLIDPKKLTKLVTNPLSRDNYLQIKENDYQDVIVSFLIDNSGSMRGGPIVMSIMACELMTQILERFSIKTEILGFTTLNWHGGKSKQLWQMMGAPENPGRLSDICHVIYKNSNQSLKQAKINLALMLKEGVLKENIDGEALLWAAKRLDLRSENRKILIVISDGAPVDDSTNSSNKKNILIDHLHHAIANIEKKSRIELAAIGIGHDVGGFYKNSVTVKDLNDLGDQLIDKLSNLL